jgi:hypothetical protein
VQDVPDLGAARDVLAALQLREKVAA